MRRRSSRSTRKWPHNGFSKFNVLPATAASELYRGVDLQVMSTSPQRIQSAAARRLAEAEVRKLIAKFAPAHQRLIAAVRRLLRKRLPAAHELVYEYRAWFVISFSPSDHGYEGVLAIRADADGVKLYFNQGKELPDPAKLLRGTSRARWIQVAGKSTLAEPEVACLIDEAIARNRVPFADIGRGPVVIRSASAKQRRSGC
jgi:hypothetical protein